MGLFEKMIDVSVSVQTAIDVVDMNLQASRGIRKSKKDKYYYLKEYDQFIETDVNEIEKELGSLEPLILARFYSVAYVDNSLYLSGKWRVGEEENYFDRLTNDVITQNKLKKLLVDFYWEDDHKNQKHIDDFDKARLYIDLIETEEDFNVILDDISRAATESSNYKNLAAAKSEAASKVRTYIRKRQASINGDSEGDESLAKTLDDLI